MRRPLPNPRAERGLLLVTVAIVVLAIAGISGGLLLRGLGDRQSVVHNETSLRALEVAEHGALVAAIELQTQVDQDGGGLGNVSGTFHGGTYDVTASVDPTNDRVWRLEALGRHGLSARQIDLGIRVRRGGVFVHALFADVRVDVEGNIQTDMWDSRLGSYNWQRKHHDGGGQYAEHGGDIGSNGHVQVDGTSAWIRGDVTPGPGETVGVTGHPTITGSTDPATQILEVEPCPFEDFEKAYLENDNAELFGYVFYDEVNMDLTLTSYEVATLEGGTYFFRNISVLDHAKIQVKGPSRIYATGRVELNGQSVSNQTMVSSNCLLVVHPYALPPGFQWTPPTSGNPKLEDRAQVVVNGGSKAAFALYAPGADIVVTGNAEFYGALVGKTITVIGNPYFHYDRELEELSVVEGGLPERIYWRDAALPPR